MVAPLINDSWQVAEAMRKVLTETYASGGQTRSSLAHAIAAINTALSDAGEDYTLPTAPETVRITATRLQRPSPDDCPHIRIVVNRWGVRGEASGAGQQGTDTHTFLVESYLAGWQADASATLTKDEVLARQALLWDKALVVAVRRRDGNGIWAWGEDSIITADRVSVDFAAYRHSTADGETEQLKVLQRWTIKQDALY